MFELPWYSWAAVVALIGLVGFLIWKKKSGG